MPKISLEFLGSGTSVGVPVIGCDCDVCGSQDPLNNRLRSSALVRSYKASGEIETTVVIDTSPDFRQQMLRAKVKHLDAVIITHFHADHVVGIDDVRRYNHMQNTALDCWATPATLASLKHSFGYAFVEGDNLRYGLPCLRAKEIVYGRAFQIGSLRFEPIELDHFVMQTTGFRISAGGESIAYCLDVKRIPEQSYEVLRGTHTLIVDMLREKLHPTHMNYDEAMAAIARVAPQQGYLAHIAHEVEHRTMQARLPENVRIAYDGLVIEVGS